MRRGRGRADVFALAAFVAFLLSPFVHGFGPWPLITLGLALLALHLLWPVIPWRRG